MRFDRSMTRLADAQNDAERRYASGVLEFVGSFVTVSALRLQPAIRRMLGDRLESIFVPLRAVDPPERAEVVRRRPVDHRADLERRRAVRLADASLGRGRADRRRVHGPPVRGPGQRRGQRRPRRTCRRSRISASTSRAPARSGTRRRGRLPWPPPGDRLAAHRAATTSAIATGQTTRRTAARASTARRSRSSAASASRWSDRAAPARAR